MDRRAVESTFDGKTSFLTSVSTDRKTSLGIHPRGSKLNRQQGKIDDWYKEIKRNLIIRYLNFGVELLDGAVALFLQF